MDITSALRSAGLSPVDSETLMAYILHCDRSYVLAHPEQDLTDIQQQIWNTCMKRRREREPVAYITGEREFYGRLFSVDRRVHIPRPSTENLVSMTLDFLKSPTDEVRELERGIIGIARVLRTPATIQTVVDVGTGSGCIAVTLALERPELRLIAIDSSPDALEVARSNTQRYGVESRIGFLCGSLLDPVRSLAEPFIVVSNPPYLSKEMIAAHPDIHPEPYMALYGGKDGAEIPAKLLQHAEKHPLCAGVIIECLQEHHTL